MSKKTANGEMTAREFFETVYEICIGPCCECVLNIDSGPCIFSAISRYSTPERLGKHNLLSIVKKYKEKAVNPATVDDLRE